MVQSLEYELTIRRIRLTLFYARSGLILFAVMLSGCIENSTPPPKKIHIEIKPEWNLFSEQQDIQLGKEKTIQFTSEVDLSQDTLINNSIDRLGLSLVKVMPDSDIPYSFHVIADPGLYAFAFPGGPVFITSGMIGAAKNESQLAGLIAHQLAHTVLRHTTSKASKKARFRVRAAFVASSTGKKTLLESLQMIGMDLHPASDLLSYAPNSELNAEALAVDIMTAVGYDPNATEDFFQVLQKDYPDRAAFFLQRHPVSDQRRQESEAIVEVEVQAHLADTEKFDQLKAQVAKLQSTESKLDALVKSYPPEEPVKNYTGPREVFITASYQFAYPATWKPGKPGPDERFQVLPKGGMFYQAGSAPVLSQGVIAGTLASGDSEQSAKSILIHNLQQIRPGLKVAEGQTGLKITESPFQSILLEGDSPILGEREYAWAVAASLPDRVFYLLMISPESQYKIDQPIFEDIFKSIQLHKPETG